MASIQGIYVALFGRPADPSGLAFFNGVTKNGADLSGIGDLTKTSEYLSRFNGMSNEQIVNSIYRSLFNRDGEKTGIDFFLAKLASGELTVNNIAIAILDGAQGDDLVTVKAKIDAAGIFTSHLDLQPEIAAYRGNAAAQIGRDFISAVTKTDPGTGEEADAAILKLLQNQGQAPGGNTGASSGSDGSSGGPQLYFKIYNHASVDELAKSAVPNGITFESNANGPITLGQSGGERDAPLQREAAAHEPSPEVQAPAALLTGARGSTPATFPNGPIDVTEGVRIATNALPEGVSLQLEDKLHVRMDAETASGHQISGVGSVCISGSEGSQTIHVTTSGFNFIEGGLDADVIDVKSASSGQDVIKINGVADFDVSQAIMDASRARDALEAREALNAAKDAVTAAEQATNKANITLQVATAADKVAEALSNAVGTLDNTIKAFFIFAFDSKAVAKAVSALEFFIENSKIIPQDLKATLLDAIPNDTKDFKVTSFLDKVHSHIDEYRNQADKAKDDAQKAFDKENGDLTTAQNKENDLAAAEDLQNREKTDATLAQEKQTAESAVEAVKDNIHTDSMIGHEDKVSGFELEKDHLNLPGHYPVNDVPDTSFTFDGHSYSVSVTNGIGHVTENSEGQSTSVVLSGNLLAAALTYLSDDHVVKQGETVAFDYMDGDETGLYVFQGGDYGSDIGVKLVGLHAGDDLDLTRILDLRLPV